MLHTYQASMSMPIIEAMPPIESLIILIFFVSYLAAFFLLPINIKRYGSSLNQLLISIDLMVEEKKLLPKEEKKNYCFFLALSKCSITLTRHLLSIFLFVGNAAASDVGSKTHTQTQTRARRKKILFVTSISID